MVFQLVKRINDEDVVKLEGATKGTCRLEEEILHYISEISIGKEPNVLGIKKWREKIDAAKKDLEFLREVRWKKIERTIQRKSEEKLTYDEMSEFFMDLEFCFRANENYSRCSLMSFLYWNFHESFENFGEVNEILKKHDHEDLVKSFHFMTEISKIYQSLDPEKNLIFTFGDKFEKFWRDLVGSDLSASGRAKNVQALSEQLDGLRCISEFEKKWSGNLLLEDNSEDILNFCLDFVKKEKELLKIEK